MTDDPGRYDAGMPRGTAELALDLAARAADAAGALSGESYAVDRVAVLGHLLLPLVVGEATVPADPRPAAGGGWVHADVLPEDEELFAILAEQGGGAAAVATRCQECRLPVTPFRAQAATWASVPAQLPAPTRRVDPTGVRVLDLSTMWAGPLATMLLAAWGAQVTTVEPAVRMDGLRGSPAQFAVLDVAKRRVPWDLRRAADRRRFEEEVATADVLVESFSRRVMPNLGYSETELRRRNPRLTIVAVRAFAHSSDEASWVAYGRGVHAASGLGMIGGAPCPVRLAYPDPLAGLQAFGAVLAALASDQPTSIEISLGGALTPLLPTAGQPLGALDIDALDALRVATGGRPRSVIVPE